MARNKRNCIERLLDYTAVCNEDIEDLSTIITRYFSNLFTSQLQVPSLNVLDRVHSSVTPEMNATLMSPYTTDEVRKALFSIGDLKPPGLDGLHDIFYKRFWPMIVDDMIMEVL